VAAVKVALIGVLLTIAGCAKPAPAPSCTMCDGVCVDTQVDSSHCGVCGLACAQGTRCEAGNCVATCSGLMCGTTCVDAANDPNNCGACGVVCTSAHAAPLCAAGVCTHGPCEDGWYDCDGDVQDGCEAQDPSCAVDICARFPNGQPRACIFLGVSGDGRRVLFRSGATPQEDQVSALFVYESTTQQTHRVTAPQDAGYIAVAAISGDGNTVAFHSQVPEDHLFIAHLDTAQVSDWPLSNTELGANITADELALSYDGRILAVDGVCDAGLCVMRIDLSTGATAWEQAQLGVFGGLPALGLSGDGHTLAFSAFSAGAYDLDVVDLDGDSVPRVALDVRDAGSSADTVPSGAAMSFDGGVIAVELSPTLGVNGIAVIAPPRLLPLGDGGVALFYGVGPTLSYDGRFIAFEQIGDFNLCKVVDLTTGLDVPFTYRQTSGPSCFPAVSGNGRVLVIADDVGHIFMTTLAH
jgi:hypothetical protein